MLIAIPMRRKKSNRCVQHLHSIEMSAVISPWSGSPGAHVFLFFLFPTFVYLLTYNEHILFFNQEKKLWACISSESDYLKSIEGYELLLDLVAECNIKAFPFPYPYLYFNF